MGVCRFLLALPPPRVAQRTPATALAHLVLCPLDVKRGEQRVLLVGRLHLVLCQHAELGAARWSLVWWGERERERAGGWAVAMCVHTHAHVAVRAPRTPRRTPRTA